MIREARERYYRHLRTSQFFKEELTKKQKNQRIADIITWSIFLVGSFAWFMHAWSTLAGS